jgi:hypothetical protein
MDDADHAYALSRAEFLRRAALGGAGLSILGGGAARLFHPREAFAEADAAAPTVQQFVSRPDLRPAVVTVLQRAAETAPGLLFLAPSSGPGQRGALIIDDLGDTIWFNPSTPDTTMDFRAGVYKGAKVLTWWEGRHLKGVGLQGSYVVADTSYRELARFRARSGLKPDFHEYLLTPEGTALVTSYAPAPADLTGVGGPKRGKVYDGIVQELEIPTGRVLFEWRSLDHVAIGESYQTEIAHPYDYFHVNSVGFDVDGHLLISARNTWTVYKVHRKTGKVIWRLGGKKSDFAMGKGAQFAFQHDARSHDAGRRISIFDNGPHPKTTPRSRAVTLAIDTKRKRATVARQIVHAPPLFARVTGNVQGLVNGDTLVCWGSTGYFSEYARDGTVRFDAKLPAGGQNYRVFRFPWVGRPTEPPRAASRTAPGGAATLYASWNGATEVVSWQLHTGATAGELHAGATTPRRGFETPLALPSGAVYAAAAALDASGRSLGISDAIRV